jgi:hypothetical protein
MMRGVPILAAVLAALAMPAAALSPALDCFANTGPEADLGGYTPQTVGNGFVYYYTVQDSTGVWLDILEYCPERRQLVLVSEREGAEFAREEAYRTFLSEMILGSDPYTMSQMERALRDMGAEVSIRRVNYESCGCSLQ